MENQEKFTKEEIKMKKKTKLTSKILAGFITGVIITLLGSPFIAIGIGIGYLIWK